MSWPSPTTSTQRPAARFSRRRRAFARRRVAASWPSLSTLAAVLAGPTAAAASENYPAIVDRRVGVECPRPLSRCLICHTTAAGGEGTANQPFAVTLRDYGLNSGKAGRDLAVALQRLPEDSDSDADGAADLDELAVCMNPSGGELGEGPGFGCSGARLAPGRGAAERHPWLAAVLAWFVLAPLRRRARRKERA